MIDREHAAPPAVPDALVFEKYLAGQHVEESASALFESAFAKPMALVAMRDPASHDGAGGRMFVTGPSVFGVF